MPGAPRWVALAAALLACAAAAAAAAAPANRCKPGEHIAPLYTYVVTSSDARLTRDFAAGKDVYRLIMDVSSMGPSVTSFRTDGAGGGAAAAGSLDALRFVRDWDAASRAAEAVGGWEKGEFPGACGLLAAQCLKSTRRAPPASVPSNALLLANGARDAAIFDVLDVRFTRGAAVFTLRYVRDPKIVGESSCHPVQTLASPHYHHGPDCTHALSKSAAALDAALRRENAGATLIVNTVAGSGLPGDFQLGIC